MGNEKERYSRSIGYSSDEPVQRCKDKSESWNTFIWRVWGKCWSTSPLLPAIVVDVLTNEITEGILQEILYTDDIVLLAESMAELQEKIYAWKSAIESKGLKVNCWPNLTHATNSFLS